jgi:adenosine kinase
MAAVICGSLAFDTIMTFEGRFADQILPDQLHILNVSFLVPTLRRDFGGCAGNIAYSLNALGGTALPMATLGNDGAVHGAHAHAGHRHRVRAPARRHVHRAGDDHERHRQQPDHRLPPRRDAAGAHHQVVARDDIKLGIVAPDGREAMLQHAEQFAAAGVPFVFDPGQGLPMFDGEALRHFVELASWVVVNDYEGKMLSQRTGWSLAEISQRVRGLVVTLAAEGCEVWVNGEREHVPGVAATEVVEPTGCGDAWRGALLFGLEKGWSLAQCAALGNKVGAIKIAQRGPQNYEIDRKALGL